MRARRCSVLGGALLVATLAGCASTAEPAEPPEPEAGPSPRAGEVGETAVWSMPEDAVVDRDTSRLTLLVSRLECSGGVTGEVLAPAVEVSDDAVTVTVDVALNEPAPARCPGNPGVPLELDLGGPPGDRVLRDGACDGEAATTSRCDLAVRWSP